jgi:hypothetical protein
MEKFDKQNVKVISKDLRNLISKYCEKNGMKIFGGKLVYSDDQFKYSFEVKLGSDVLLIRARDFAKSCHKYGLKERDFQKKFIYKDEQYIVIGIKSRKQKFPIICENLNNGKNYKFGVEFIKSKICS